ncbi:hypothetical protein BFR57_03810 [Idiomarina sp. MD25a]|uniref:NADH-quinone oxidoreductase subunit L n=1 Tax=Idiomarina sp. MD25a TaxID=1889913 RepID=UPI0008F91EFE|nr:NADH-quinone oxidoreductase subunit L [Idiomarina sp. MD25a]OIM99700.1 hypothetical protein BFR57_03810 [Idiomarina sp. MD25a]
MGATTLNWIQIDELRVTLVVMVALLSWVVLRYTWRNFALEPSRPRAMGWMLGCLVSVVVTLVANHFILFLLSWISISVCLHRLLLFYPERARAVLATHKRMITARLTEVLLVVSFIQFYLWSGDATITGTLAHYYSTNTVPTGAMLTLVIAALLSCAQMPFHGWLMQVVESPTSVSSLLHAGIVNLGGFLLLSFAPLLTEAESARWLLGILSAVSCGLAILIMSTRISIKIRLAWSTCAQMGLMLLEIALGYYSLALLHLVAHSLYKAYAFLSSGTVRPIHNVLVRNSWITLAWFIFSLVLINLALWLSFGHFKPTAAVLLSLSITLLMSQAHKFSWFKSVLIAVVWVAIYTGLTLSAAQLMQDGRVHIMLDLAVAAWFIVLVALYWWLEQHVAHQVSQRWFIRLNAGLYIDEWFTRLALWLWPRPEDRHRYESVQEKESAS